MTKNAALSGYDMVLALSEATINYQFAQLYKQNIIRKSWEVLAGQILNPKKDEKPFFITAADADWRAKRDRWVELQRQIEEEEAYELMSVLKKEHINFDFGWDAQIQPPTISIRDQDARGLILQIAFKQGQLYYLPDRTGAVNSYDLKDCVYAFYVPIGKITVNMDQMIMEADDEMAVLLKESGLSEEDFTIESLFLNFERADISTFDKSRSKFPEQVALPLQVAVQNYFNLVVAGSDNPFVLGYGVTRRRITSQEDAMFQPTSTHFSATYSSRQSKEVPVKGQFSAFNFLMMLANAQPPYDQNTGILPQSLIELEQDTSSTTDGVFAIDEEVFGKYIRFLDDYVASIFAKQQGVDLHGGFKNGKLTCTHHGTRKDDTIDTTYTVTREPVKNRTDPAGIEVRYTIEIKVEVVVNAIVIVKLFEKHINLSTSGQYTHDKITEKGQKGSLTFVVKNGKGGRFDLDHSLVKPKIAFDQDVEIFSGNVLQVLLKILDFIILWPLKIVNAIMNQIAVDLGIDNLDNTNAMTERLNNLDVLNQTNRVILPLGKTYAYKNLRYIPEKKLVAYDISYAPVNE